MSGSRSRRVRQWFAVPAAVCLLAAACTTSTDGDQSNTSSPPTASETSTTATVEPGTGDQNDLVVLDPGSEPRELLEISEEVEVTFEVVATEESEVSVDGEVTSKSASAEYLVVVQLSAGDGGFVARADPTIVSMAVEAAVPDELGVWTWTLSEQGATLAAEANDFPPINPDVLELLTFPHLFLEVPEEPVGSGARWAKTLNDASGVEMVVEVGEITETEIDVTIEIVVALNDGEMSTTTEAIYHRNSLLALVTSTETTLTAEVSANHDGNQTVVSGVQRSTRALNRVEP